MDTWDIVGSICIILAILSVACLGYYEYNKSTIEYKSDYYEVQFGNSSHYWHKEVVNISASGNMDTMDWVALQDVMNEWNMIGDPVPDLEYDNSYPDITISWRPMENETYAGATWWYVEGDSISSASIVIRTSWNDAREMVIRHELGHAMGLSYHSNHPNSTMYKYANGAVNWSEEDLTVISHLYTYHKLPQ